MGKIIRHTITITITESWTIVWLPDDDHAVGAKRQPLSQPATVLHNTLHPKEEPDETLQVTLNAGTDLPSAKDPPPGGVSTRSTTSRQRKRSRGQRAADNP